MERQMGFIPARKWEMCVNRLFIVPLSQHVRISQPLRLSHIQRCCQQSFHQGPGLSATSVHVFVRMSADVATVDTRMITGACVRDGNHDEECTKNDSDIGDVEDACVK